MDNIILTESEIAKLLEDINAVLELLECIFGEE